jgi:hypothetical protein
MWKLAIGIVLAIGCGDQDKPPVVPDAATTGECTASTCDPAHDYCFRFEAGFAPTIGCNAIPAGCSATPTCACITATISETSCGLSCVEGGPGAVVVTCTGI